MDVGGVPAADDVPSISDIPCDVLCKILQYCSDDNLYKLKALASVSEAFYNAVVQVRAYTYAYSGFQGSKQSTDYWRCFVDTFCHRSSRRAIYSFNVAIKYSSESCSKHSPPPLICTSCTQHRSAGHHMRTECLLYLQDILSMCPKHIGLLVIALQLEDPSDHAFRRIFRHTSVSIRILRLDHCSLSYSTVLAIGQALPQLQVCSQLQLVVFDPQQYLAAYCESAADCRACHCSLRS